MLTATVSTGKTNMEALAGSLHSVMPAAASAGISLKELLGAVGTMTAEGISADQATQNLNNSIQQLQSPSSIAQKEMAQMGLSFIDVSQKLGQRGLTGTLQMMSDAVIQHMGPSGLVIQSAMNQSKVAAQSARDEMAKMPPQMQKMAQSFLDNKITQKEWAASLKNLPVETANLGKQFQFTAKHATGFSDMLRAGGGVAQTYQGALSKMTGGMTGLQVALHLTGDHMGTFKSNVDTIGKATSETGGHVRGWADTQKGFNVQMGIAVESGKNLGIVFGTALLPVLTTVMKGFTGFFGGLRDGNGAAIALAATLGIVGALLTAAYVKQVLFAEGSTMLKAATWLVTAAQWAYDAALAADPITLIIMAIVALVAGLVWFFTQTKLGQQIWTTFVKVLGDAWNWLWNSVLHPVFIAIGAIFTWLWNSVIMPVVNFIVGAVRVLAAIFTWLWNSILHPIIEIIQLGFFLLGLGVKALWELFVMPAVNAIGAIFKWLWDAVLSPVFTAMGVVFNWFWQNIVQPISALIQLELTGLGIVFNWLYTAIIQPVFTVIGAIFKWLWETIISPVVNFIVNGINIVGTVIGIVFGSIGNTVKGAFNGVVEFVRGIFNGIIDMVNGVIGTINGIGAAVAGIPGAPKIHIGTLPHLATGGTMTRAGMALVGENGPEVVKLPAGATVYPHGGVPANQSGGGLHIENFYATPEQSPREISQELGWMQRWAT
jgi:hypothetical protein